MATINDNADEYIGVDLSGSTLRAVLVGGTGVVRLRREAPMPAHALSAAIADLVGELQSQSADARSLGVGVPGLVNPRTRRVEISADFPALTEHDLHAEIAAATTLPTTLANDANSAAFAEFTAGAGAGSRSMFYALIGKGIGGALILDGRLWTGATGYAGEFGYMAVDDSEGGTVLEAVASAPNIVRRTQERLFRDGTSSLSRLAMNRDFKAADIAREAKNGDDFALMMIERTGRYIGTALASVINLLNIERIVLGGGIVAEAGDLILDPITREAASRSFRPCFEATTIRAAALGADAVSIGAALLARDAALHNTTI